MRSPVNTTVSPVSGFWPASAGGLSITLNSVLFSSKRNVVVDCVLPPALTTAAIEIATAHTAAGRRRRRMTHSVLETTLRRSYPSASRPSTDDFLPARGRPVRYRSRETTATAAGRRGSSLLWACALARIVCDRQSQREGDAHDDADTAQPRRRVAHRLRCPDHRGRNLRHRCRVLPRFALSRSELRDPRGS